MYEEKPEGESFEDFIRSMANEIGRSVERMTQIDLDEVARNLGIEGDRAREWFDQAGRWLRNQAEGLGHDAPFTARPGDREEAWRGDRDHTGPGEREDPLRNAAPHPLDLPTEEQGLALAALDSGRWTMEPGSNTLAPHGEGPRPNDALGLVRELHARDWIDTDGKVTLAGRRALSRWLEATGH